MCRENGNGGRSALGRAGAVVLAVWLASAVSVPRVAAQDLYRSDTFVITDTSVHQGAFRAVATSRERIESNYQRAAVEVNFKFSINGLDNEHPPGDDYMIYLRPRNGRLVTPVYRFGELEEPSTPAPELASANREEGLVDVTFRLDLRHVLDSLRTHSVYTPPNGAPIRAGELEAVYVIGNTEPLSWDFGRLTPGAPVQLHDEDGDGIYEVTLRFDARFSRRLTPDGLAEWVRTRDLGRFPVLESRHRLIDALHALALEELLELQREDGALNAGARWPGVWTRDQAWGALLGIVLVMPDAVRHGLLARVDTLGRIIQDSGSGGSWPVSTDRVAWSLAAWELFAVTGDTAWLRTAHDVIRRTAEADLVVAYDSVTGLFRGESTFLDWRDQSYPRWMDPKDIGVSESLGTIVLHYESYRVLARMARLLGEPADRWDAIAESVRRGLDTHLWQPAHGYHAQFRYGRLSRATSPRAEMLGEALAVIHGVHDVEKRAFSASRVPVVPFGVPSFWPYIPDLPPYHNAGVWPQVVGFWGWASAEAGHEAGVEHALANVYRAAALFLTNKENWVAATGHFEGTEVNSDRFMASAATQLATHYRILFGIRLEADRMVLRPFVPRSYAGTRTLRNLRYRDTMLTVTVHGFGSAPREVRLNGRVVPAAEVPATLTGTHTIEIVMNGSVPASEVNLAGNIASPRTPETSFEEGRIVWTRVERAASYVVYRNGGPITTTRDTAHPAVEPTGIAEYQVLAVDDAGLESFLSEPLRVGPPDAERIVEPASNLLETEAPGYEGAGYVTLSRAINTAVDIAVSAPVAGWYAIDARYANGGGAVSYGYRGAARGLFVNGSAAGTLLLPQRGIGRWDDWGYSNAVRAWLHEGGNTLTIIYGDAYRNMDATEDSARLDHIRIARLAADDATEGAPGNEDHATMPGAQVARTLERRITRDVSGRYLLHLPRDYDASRSWPLLLFLHGAGERGDDLDRVAIHGPPRLVREATMELPFIVVSPQVPDDRIWSIQFLDALLEELVETLAIDEDRIYLTGLSMGAYGAWHLAMEYPHRFAALVPISGGATITGACTLRHLPVWAFHGALDEVVPPSRSDELITRLRDCDGHVRYTRYEDAGHDAWTRTYADPALYEWLLQHRRGKPGPRDDER